MNRTTTGVYLILTAIGVILGIVAGFNSNSEPAPAAARLLQAPDEIIGAVYHDLNGNGALDAGEPGLDGVNVQLTNPNSATSTGSTSGGGIFIFGPPAVLTGTHTLTLLTPAGYTPTSPTTLTVDKQAGVESNDNNFGLQPLATATPTSIPASIAGYIYHDQNSNGVRDSSEVGVAGVSVTITGPVTRGAASGSPDGFYIFTSVPDGIYTIQVNWAAAGYQPTSADTLIAAVSGGVGVENRNFGGQPAPTPTATQTPTTTPTSTSQPRSISFTVDDDSITAGDCVEFKWTVTGPAQSVLFDGDSVASSESQEECPTKTKKYELRVIWTDGTVESRTIEVKVKTPTATPAPATPAPAPTATSVTGSGVALAVNPYQGAAGEAFSFVGSGFNDNEAISIGMAQPDGTVIGLPAQQANSAGSFAFSFTTKPEDQIGLYTMITEGRSSQRRASAAFIVDDAPTPTPVAVVINSRPDGTFSGSIGAGAAGPTPTATPDPLLSSDDPLLTNLTVVPLDDDAASGGQPAADQIPGVGGRK